MCGECAAMVQLSGESGLDTRVVGALKSSGSVRRGCVSAGHGDGGGGGDLCVCVCVDVRVCGCVGVFRRCVDVLSPGSSQCVPAPPFAFEDVEANSA